MEVIGFLTSRPVIITLAIVGGVIAMLGSYLLREGSKTPERNAKLIMRSGYAITWASVAAFIVAGFLIE